MLQLLSYYIKYMSLYMFFYRQKNILKNQWASLRLGNEISSFENKLHFKSSKNLRIKNLF